MQLKATHSQQGGFTLIEVMIACVIIGLVVASLTALFGNSSWVQTQLASKRATAGIDDILRTNLAADLKRHVALGAGCSSASYEVAAPNNDLTNGVRIQTTRIQAVQTIPTGAPATVFAARNRCLAAPRSPAPGFDRFQFCLTFSGAPRVGDKKNTILKTDRAFVEVLATFTNLATGAPATCTQFRNTILNPGSGSAGIVLAYTLYTGVMAPTKENERVVKFNTLSRMFYIPGGP